MKNDEKLVKAFYEAIETRAEQLNCNEVHAFMAGYLQSFITQNMNSKMRKAMEFRLEHYNP